MKLTELLTRITPLPHEVRKGDLHTENLVADVRGVTIFGSYKAVRAIDDAIYQAHAANVLPDLVAALKEIISENPTPTLPYGFRVNEIAKAALESAENVETMP